MEGGSWLRLSAPAALLVALLAWAAFPPELGYLGSEEEGRMRAAVWGWTGGLSLDAAHKVPTCGKGEVKLKVRAAAINPVDYKMGRLLGQVAGMDVAGVVEEVGKDVTSLQVGDSVFGGVSGSLADFAVTKPDTLGKMAEGQGFVEAAAMPIAYLTSLQSLRDAGGLVAGGRLLVLGASGGCGIAALQIAKGMGAGHIAAVCSGKNEALVRENGADEVVDYTTTSLAEHYTNMEEAARFDVIYDAASGSGAGEDYRAQALPLLKQEEPRGQYVAINGAASMWARRFTIGQKKDQHLVLTEMNTKDLEELARMVAEGTLRPVVAKQLALTEEAVREGFDLLRSRRARGKVVFDMDM